MKCNRYERDLDIQDRIARHKELIERYDRALKRQKEEDEATH